MDIPYNPDSLNYMDDKFKDMAPEDASQLKALIHQNHTYFSVLLSAYSESYNFQESWHHEDPEEHEILCTSIQK